MCVWDYKDCIETAHVEKVSHQVQHIVILYGKTRCLGKKFRRNYYKMLRMVMSGNKIAVLLVFIV